MMTTSDALRMLARAEQRRRATGAYQRQPTYCMVTAPAEWLRDSRIQAQLKAALPQSVQHIVWGVDNGRDLTGCGLTVGGDNWVERRPLPTLRGVPGPPPEVEREPEPPRGRNGKATRRAAVEQVDDQGEPLPKGTFRWRSGRFMAWPEDEP
jgi:hypothetical protein